MRVIRTMRESQQLRSVARFYCVRDRYVAPAAASHQARFDVDSRPQREVNRASIRDRQQSCALAFVERPVELDIAIDHGEPRVMRLTRRAVFRMHPRVAQSDG